MKTLSTLGTQAQPNMKAQSGFEATQAQRPKQFGFEDLETPLAKGGIQQLTKVRMKHNHHPQRQR